MSSSSFSLYRKLKTNKQNSNIFLTCYCPWYALVLMNGRHYTMHSGTQARACVITYLLHTQYSQIHQLLFSLITALTHIFINSQISILK